MLPIQNMAKPIFCHSPQCFHCLFKISRSRLKLKGLKPKNNSIGNTIKFTENVKIDHATFVNASFD